MLMFKQYTIIYVNFRKWQTHQLWIGWRTHLDMVAHTKIDLQQMEKVLVKRAEWKPHRENFVIPQHRRSDLSTKKKHNRSSHLFFSIGILPLILHDYFNFCHSQPEQLLLDRGWNFFNNSCRKRQIIEVRSDKPHSLHFLHTCNFSWFFKLNF